MSAKKKEVKKLQIRKSPSRKIKISKKTAIVQKKRKTITKVPTKKKASLGAITRIRRYDFSVKEAWTCNKKLEGFMQDQ